MNWADYVIIAVLALSVLIGLWRGLIAEVLALAVWIAAAWVAWAFGPKVATVFRGMIDEPSIRVILGYALCFVAVLIVGALLKFLIDKLVEGTGLSGSDRMLGMVFGLARGLLLVTVVVFLLEFTPFTRDPWWHRSKLLPTFIGAADWMSQHLPQSVHRYLHPQSMPQPHIDLTSRSGSVSPSWTAMSSRIPDMLNGGQPAMAASTAGKSAARVALPTHSRDN